jgi:phosphate transport system permease protein
MGTIAAVLLVVFVLLATAWPLHRSPEFSNWRSVPANLPSVLHASADEYGLIVWTAEPSGEITVRSSTDGRVLDTIPSPGSDDRQVTASCLSIDRQTLTLGFSDGTFQSANLVFQSDLLAPEQLPEGVAPTSQQRIVVQDRTIYELFDQGAIRRLELLPPQWSTAAKLADEPLIAIDYQPPDTSNQFSQQSSSVLVALTRSELISAQIESRENLLTGEVAQDVTALRTQVERRSNNPPLALMLANRANQAIVAWEGGTLDRFAIEPTGPQLVESVSGLPDGGRFTAAAPLISRQTLLLGDEQGRLHGWNVIQDADAAEAADGYRLMETHEVQLGKAPIRHIASSSASHLALVSTDRGRLSLVMTTTDTHLRQVAVPGQPDIETAFLTLKNDGVFVLSPKQLARADVDVAYPEATLRGLFGRVWYEGHAEPKYLWQSSAGTEQSEPKLSLIPLVFGTLKATLYAMVVSIPLAILAAIYTSEFLSPRMRGRVKPVIELMASLPSVILGFVAALVLAPLLQENLCAVLLSLFIVPATFVYAAHLWNLLPLEILVRLQAWRLWCLAACIPIALSIAFSLGPPVERWLFAGDIVLWMSGAVGTAVGGWMLLLVPAVVFAAVFAMLGPLAEFNKRTAITTSPRAFAMRGLVQLILMTIGVIAVAWLASLALTRVGLDPRDSLFVGYQERNSLLVGAVLGFCVIPLIYTLADDALQSVPQQLRSASLGCGATLWQTTVRVVVPSAMSGMFSAIMIGLGRAVGETMVVLMAAGNTPIMQWNPFNGFRTLSATLATELPEAAKGSTHFRTLFLAALLLFTLTLIANTLAEFVRIRFRRRGSQL